MTTEDLVRHAKADISNSSSWIVLLSERALKLEGDLAEAQGRLERVCHEEACGECAGCLAAKSHLPELAS